MAEAKPVIHNSLPFRENRAFHSDKPHRSAQKQRSSNILQIIPGEGSLSTSTLGHQVANRSSSNTKRAPPVQRLDSATRRTPTPTKEISLLAVRRKLECDSELYTNLPSRQVHSVSGLAESSTSHRTHAAVTVTQNSVHRPSATSHEEVPTTRPPRESSARSGHKQRVTRDSRRGKDDDDNSSSEDDQPTRAPNELMMEFLSCVMMNDYVNARKLCTMILIYEPQNPEALSFQPLIEEKIRIDELNAAKGNDSDTTDDESSETDSSDDESNENADDKDDADDNDDDDEEDEYEQNLLDNVESYLSRRDDSTMSTSNPQ